LKLPAPWRRHQESALCRMGHRSNRSKYLVGAFPILVTARGENDAVASNSIRMLSLRGLLRLAPTMPGRCNLLAGFGLSICEYFLQLI
jgi:hypothetical protein